MTTKYFRLNSTNSLIDFSYRIFATVLQKVFKFALNNRRIVGILFITKILVTANVLQQVDDAVLSYTLRVYNWYHIKRIFPVNNCCIIPCRIDVYFSFFFSSSAISASISDNISAIARCSEISSVKRICNLFSSLG